ncbi:MAG TPA: ketoacyl-ACP synthase III [Blastocatellia bacterium]|nr:ketoacyl-ACP synthase III [Blastocatellia bacterium]
MSRFARIAGTGRYVPEKVLTNDQLSRMLGEDINDFVAGVVGIRERHICSDEESTADLATNAARDALSNAGVDPLALDLIIVASDTPEYISPATSSVVQSKLGAHRAANFDVNCACASFVTALDTAAKFIIADRQYKNILVIGAYAMSKYLDWGDKKTCTIFADGAGAVVLQASKEGPGYLGSRLAADGSYHDAMGIYAGGTHLPTDERVLAEGRFNRVRFVKKIPAEFNLEHWPLLIREVLDRCEMKLDDVAMFIFTQVNLSTIKEVMKALELPMSRTHTVMDKWGYTGSACIPMALDDAARQGKIKTGDNIILCASGGGVSMACAAFRWTI